MKLQDLIPIILGLVFSYAGRLILSELVSASSKVKNFAQNAKMWHLILRAMPILAFLIFLISILIYGIYWHFAYGLHDVVEIKQTSSRNLPPGEYSAWALSVLLLGLLSFFLCILYGVISSAWKGVKARKKL